ncbi:catechol 1,2-dioxygenase [Derxia lacustris]|uniref:catechol 1,2-dioxygenase n=1 Tax=Derxia lacustris TaxID=764842 RepID=UPI000A17082F|nr:catechol 1,2-dioxygenase [Derxia lacustris]
MDRKTIDALVARFASTGVTGPGDERIKTVVNRLLGDLMLAIEDLDIQPGEFWSGLNFLAEAGPELGLIAAGTGLEHYLDLRMDEAEARAGLAGGTPRTIEGPLYVAGAPVAQGHARLDDGTQPGDIVVMHGVVRGSDGKPVAGALVEAWHANHLGNYSHFDKNQAEFNLRRGIVTDAEGRYSFRTIMPVGYSVPPGGTTERLLTALGRHGHRPAHIHFFVTAPGFRKLTTQINIESDPHLWDDFAFGTRDGLVPPIRRAESLPAYGVDQLCHEIEFDFDLHAEVAAAPRTDFERLRAAA